MSFRGCVLPVRYVVVASALGFSACSVHQSLAAADGGTIICHGNSRPLDRRELATLQDWICQHGDSYEALGFHSMDDVPADILVELSHGGKRLAGIHITPGRLYLDGRSRPLSSFEYAELALILHTALDLRWTYAGR